MDSDSDRTSRALDGDRDAFSWLYERLGGWLFLRGRVVMGRELFNRLDVEQAIVDVFMILWERRAGIRGQMGDGDLLPVVRSFLQKTFGFVSANAARRLGGDRAHVALSPSTGSNMPRELVDSMTSVGMRFHRKEVMKALDAAAQSWPPEQREVFTYRMDGQSNIEIGARLGKTPGNVSQIFHRAKEAIPPSILLELRIWIGMDIDD